MYVGVCMEAPLVAVCMYYVCRLGAHLGANFAKLGPPLGSKCRESGRALGRLWGATVCMYVCRSLGAPLVAVCTYLAGVASGCQLGEAGAVSGEQVYGVWESLGAPLGSNCM